MKRRLGLLLAMTASLLAFAAPVSAGPSWGPATPDFNLQAILRPVADGPDDAFGLVKFRQPKDADTIVYLDVWVRDLAPDRIYLLQRATDTAANDDCTGTNWLTLGDGPAAHAITTDAAGTGQADLFRALPASLIGTPLDIQFRVIDAVTSDVVLRSACYQFTTSQ